MKAKYIKRIEINNLWNKLSVKWDLRPDVNILAGINGVGKTTILNRVINFLEEFEGQDISELPAKDFKEVKVVFDNPDGSYIPYNVIRSYDRPLLTGDFAAKVDKNVKSELDWQLYLLQRRYLDYQVNMGNRMIELLADSDPKKRELAAEIACTKKRFQDIIDELFSYTKKTIDRKRNEIAFKKEGGGILHPYQLSSGEKQVLVILLTVLVQDNQHYVLFMDEPEASLHIEWQQRLITTMLEINPNVQLILTTHSPAVAMEGWLDAVTEVSDISTFKE